MVALLGLALAAATASAATDVSGTWAFTIERSTGPVNATAVFKQAGEKLTGTYSGLFGEHKFDGTLKGDKAVFTWENTPDANGKRPPIVTFNGILESPTRMTGTVEVPYCPEGQQCKWTATKGATKKK
jgi:hypothetical protein